MTGPAYIPEPIARWLFANPWRPFAVLAVYGAAATTACLLHLMGVPFLEW